MRKILHVGSLILLCFLTVSFTDVKYHEGPTGLLGSWEYMAPAISWKYQKGAIEFRFEEEVLKGKVIFNDLVIPMRNLIYEDHILRAHLIFEGSQIDVFLRFQEDSFKGTVSSPQGYMRISGCKIVE